MAETEKSKSKQGNGESTKQKNEQQQQERGQKSQQKQGQQKQSQQKKDVGWPEWITFAVGLVIVLGVIGLQIYLHVEGETGPPRIVVQPDLAALYQEGNDYYLPVKITNEGGSTAEDVNVQISLENISGKAETISLLVDFLSPEEVSQPVVVFKTNPSQGDLTYLVTFKNP